jgi:hypothetical protein
VHLAFTMIKQQSATRVFPLVCEGDLEDALDSALRLDTRVSLDRESERDRVGQNSGQVGSGDRNGLGSSGCARNGGARGLRWRG